MFQTKFWFICRFSPSGIWTPLVESLIKSSDDPEKAIKDGENSFVKYCFLLEVFNLNSNVTLTSNTMR